METFILASDKMSDEDVNKEVKPSQHAASEQALLACLILHNYRHAKAAFFKKLGKQIIFTKEMEMGDRDELVGRFTEMLPPILN